MSLFPSQIAHFLNTAFDYLSPQSSPIQTEYPSLIQPSSSPLKERLDAACQSPTSTLAHLSPSSMRRELDVTKHDLARAHADSTRLEERCKMLERTLRETRDLLRSREAELEKLKRERERDRAMAERRRSDVGPQRGAYTMQGHAGSSLDTRMAAADLAKQMHTNRMHLHDDDVSRTRTPSPSHTSSASASSSAGTGLSTNGTTINGNADEDRARIRSAETYMTRIDSWSGAQVLQAVHDINSEILQFAASATEMCTFHPPSSNARQQHQQALQDTTTRIGPSMTRILTTRDHSQDPLLVQLALQGCVSLCIARALASFCIGFPSKSDAVLAQIYAHMQVGEPQPTAARWRALTHQHIHGLYPTLGAYSVGELSETMVRWCADVLVLANGGSFTRSSSPSVSTSPPTASSLPTQNQTPATALRHLYLDQLKRIAHSVLRLASVTREEIMSTSFEVTIADPSVAFDSREMVDAFGDYCVSEGRILVSMELGLRCVTRVSVGLEGQQGGQAQTNGNGERQVQVNGDRGKETGEGRFETRLLLQPKVVLESVLEVLDR